MKKEVYILISLLLILAGCSTTSGLPDGEQLFTGLEKTVYTSSDKSAHATETREEMESVLASAPNGALFGSSYYRTPFPVRLWIWNAFARDSSSFAHWIVRSFGSTPKLMSQVNPELRSQVAINQLRNYGYFDGRVSYKNITMKNPKKGKVAYTVDMGHLWTVDTLTYVGFTPRADSLLRADSLNALIHSGDPFSTSSLESERQRVTTLLRNNGYYYYQNSYATYLADTLQVPGKVSLRLQTVDSLPPASGRQWYIGHITINYRKEFMDSLRNSRRGRYFTLHYPGSKPPIRAGAILSDISLRPREMYSYQREQLSLRNLQSTGLFSYTNLAFTPRDTTAACDTLDAELSLVFDKPYDFYIEANAKGKTTNRIGPNVTVGMTKRNAFRGGEKLDISLNGSYEWTTGHSTEGSSSGVNSYEYGADASLTFPRLMTPWTLFERVRRRQHRQRPRRHFYSTPTTTIDVSTDVINRAHYFKRHVVSGYLAYDWRTSAQTHHQFTPLSISYEYMQSRTARFDSLLEDNPYLQVSMRDQFVPKMSYTFSYQSSSTLRNPIAWSFTATEAANIISLGYMAFGEKWGEKNKTMFRNPYAQFLKFETDFVKTWSIAEHSSIVGHVAGGVIWSYGNASSAPYYEQFYVGGANSVRAFNVRSIGPGKYMPAGSKYSYIDQTGDVKLLMNLEYRPRLSGDLYGALFLDAGNVWTLHEDAARPGGKFDFGNCLKRMALGTGVGLRYDMGMFVIRLDWGIGLHVPYDSSRSGFYNVESFKDAQSIHLAVGYPF